MQEREFINKLKRFYWGLKPEMKEWYRTFIFSIPGKTGDFIRKGYARRNFKSCGINVGIAHHVQIFNPQNFIVGDNVLIADFVQISAGGGVRFGNRVMIAPDVKIWSNNHRFDRIDIPIYEQGWTTDPVIIEDDVFVAMGAIILPGAHVGKGSIVSAGTVLGKKVIKPYSIVAGNPGRIIGSRIPEEAIGRRDDVAEDKER